MFSRRRHALETRSGFKDFVVTRCVIAKEEEKMIEATILASASSLCTRQLNIQPKVFKKGVGECDLRKEGQLVHYIQPNPRFRTIKSIRKIKVQLNA
jgi:NCAIR mutase (PurE)-related protein